jgi:Peptidase A4 family
MVMTTQSGASNQQDLERLLEQIKARTTLFPLPPEGFDPLTASKEELEHFGLPLEPDPDKQPALNAFWRRMYERPDEFRPIDFGFKNIERLTSVNHRQQALGLRTRGQTSPNWSGAYIKPRDGQVFTSICGQWQVPTPSVPPNEVGAGRYYRCSTWIGLDGQRRYYQSSLPQIGTEQSIDDASGKSEFSAWWQWWVRDHYFPPVDMGLTIHAGDVIMCNLRVVPPGRNKVRFQLRNQSTMSQVIEYADAPTLPIPLQVSGATAEWITERPAIFPTPILYEFPNYNTVLFSDCVAVTAPPSGGPGVERRLEGCRLIDMREARVQPQRTAKISDARLVNERQVLTRWLP